MPGSFITYLVIAKVAIESERDAGNAKEEGT